MHLDAGYDSNITRQLLDSLGLHGEIARKGVPAPVQIGKRWVTERTHSLRMTTPSGPTVLV